MRLSLFFSIAPTTDLFALLFCHLLTFVCFSSKQGKYLQISFIIARLSNDYFWSASSCPSSDDKFSFILSLPYKRPPFEGDGNAIPIKVPSGQGPHSFQKTFPEAGIVIPTKVLRLRPTFLSKRPPFYYLLTVAGFISR
jgi:hypothetical protein